MISGLYETVLVEDGRVRLLGRHLSRLGAAGVDAHVVDSVAKQLDRTCRVTRQPTVIRVDVQGAVVTLTPRAPRPATPVRLVIVPGYDPADAARTQKRSDRSWAVEPERAAGEDEALLVSSDGLVGETTRANLFAVLGDEIATPPVEGLLPGVTRDWVLHQTGATERHLTRSELAGATTVFVTSAGRGVVQVLAVDDRPVADHPLVGELHRAWRALPG